MIAISNHTSLSAAAAQDKKIEEAKKAKEEKEEKQRNQAEGSESPGKLTRDTYTPEETPLSMGIYDKDGKTDSPKASAPAGKSAEEKTATANTDEVDREIEKLKKKKAQLKQEIAQTKDAPDKQEDLKKQLSQVEEELRRKDNDAYRRQHAKITYR